MSLNRHFTFCVFAAIVIGFGAGCNSNNPVKANPQPVTVTDIDGNIYHTVTIGTQVWMVENLKTTRYNDGTAIALVTDDNAWMNLTTGAFCWYNNDSATYKNPYGALYNWYAVNTGKLAPTGWHVPSDSEWSVLVAIAGGDAVAGGALKEAGTTHWASPNSGATNNPYGFSAFPGGSRTNVSTFVDNGNTGYFWASTTYSGLIPPVSWGRYMNSSSPGVDRNYFNFNVDGFSVRCVRNP